MAVSNRSARPSLILPQPAETWNRRDQARRDEALRQADQNNHKRNQDIEVGDGRIIIRSPNGARWSIAIDDGGTISAQPVT